MDGRRGERGDRVLFIYHAVKKRKSKKKRQLLLLRYVNYTLAMSSACGRSDIRDDMLESRRFFFIAEGVGIWDSIHSGRFVVTGKKVVSKP